MLVFSLCVMMKNTSAQKIIFNEIGFKLKSAEREEIQKLAKYEVKIYNSLFKQVNSDSLIIQLYLYRNSKDFKFILDKYHIKGLTESGFYSPSDKKLFVFYKDAKAINTVMHEISHALLHHNLKNAQNWFNEGLAVFLESLEIENNEIAVYTQHNYIDFIKKLLFEKGINFKDFFNESQQPWLIKERQQYLYAVSYSIIYFIIQTQPAYIKEIALLMKTQKDPQLILGKLYGDFKSFENKYKVFYSR
jgi:hypothetical protein